MDTFFAKNCEVLRRSKGWKQSEIEGFSVSTWSNYENGRSVPGFDDLIKISKIFAISVDELLFTDLSKNLHQNENRGKPARRYQVSENQDQLSIVQDEGKNKEDEKLLVQRILGIENRLAKLEKLVKKISDKLK